MRLFALRESRTSHEDPIEVDDADNEAILVDDEPATVEPTSEEPVDRSHEVISIEEEMVRHAIMESMKTSGTDEDGYVHVDADAEGAPPTAAVHGDSDVLDEMGITSGERQTEAGGPSGGNTLGDNIMHSLGGGFTSGGMGYAGGFPPFFRVPQGPHDPQYAELPNDVDREEAAMLEAAMLGVPYQGNYADRVYRAAAPPSPNSHARQSLRSEQDAAYEESLAMDQQREEENKRIAEEAERRLALEREEQERVEAERARMEAEKHRLLEEKACVLPDEPPKGSEGAMECVVRLPNGQRCTRLFLQDHPAKHLFDFVDLQQVVDPHTYRLVAQYPRRVLEADTSHTFFEAGFTGAHEVFFIESL